MNDIARTTSQPLQLSGQAKPLPQPKVELSFRLATMEDAAFIEALQKKHGKALGFFPRGQMEGYIRNQWTLIAQNAATGAPLGFCASRDRYLKRDELGVIYQLCVAPGHHRGYVGAALIREVFNRSAYGCRLYCCWCAQDLEANYFWESLGFVAIAFRAGSDKKRRVHIFWQKRIREGDRATQWWFPSKTESGAIRADRLVFPIPPGVHWKDVSAVQLAEGPDTLAPALESDQAPARKASPPARREKGAAKPAAKVKISGRLFFGPPPAPKKARQKPAPPKKINPEYVTAARELRDRWLEHVAERPDLLDAPAGKYLVARSLEDRAAPFENKLLAA